VVRLPFIPETSLGHEILHQWFGNLVYIDYAKGNWAEGLTTYLQTISMKREKGRGRIQEGSPNRLSELLSTIGMKIPLRELQGQGQTMPRRRFGYGKALMVFPRPSRV